MRSYKLQCRSVFVIVSLLVATVTIAPLQAQNDPGPRSGPPAAGSFYPTLNSNEQIFFNQAQLRFQEINSVLGLIAGEESAGLGPTFNGNSCAQCHAQPTVGGTSPGLTSPQNPIPNPQVALATLDGASNVVPSFITATGPVREARFIKTASGALDGGVHDLYTIAGRSDAVGCTLSQPDFPTALSANNVIFRVPTPLFGLGLVEATPDANLQANLDSTKSARAALKIGGVFNTSGNDGTITRFGWKAQNKSLAIFAGEAYNVEQGVSNELFPNERSAVPGCVFNPSPEDATPLLNGNSSSPNFGTPIGTASEMTSDAANFAAFIRLSAPATPAASTASTLNGAAVFSNIGCNLCHSPALTTGASIFTGMSNVTYNPFSDFALHNMGVGLADGVHQGAAGPNQFRTAPLWGLGQRLFFLHDGRTTDLIQAIQSHSSSGSEATLVVHKFNALKASDVQDLLNFLRSL
ncbi:MAG TPA: di-heme oxidoredictase family protein [Candidatus Sulfotelmatobacter sp.]|nr:di-heme oxidoredictase family protein [Candidatus Sulfotelmatobacter sp.]